MIAGTVNAALEPHIAVNVLRRAGGYESVDALLDTGFNGYLTLPPHIVQQLRLELLGEALAILADGSEVVSEVYAAVVEWDTQPREIEVDAADAGILLGMSMLAGYDLTMRVDEAGEVILRRIPAPNE